MNQPTAGGSADAGGRGQAGSASYTKFVSGILFPLHERLKGHDSPAIRRALEQSQWWEREQLESLQLARLRRLLQHAAQHVPYYRDLFKRLKFAPSELRAVADIARLPFLTKADIRANLDAFKSDQGRDLRRFNTGGSTGEPLIFFLGKERVSHDVAAKWRATRWWGVDIGDPEVVVWGSPIELGAQDLLRGIWDALMRTELLPAFEMSESRLDDFVARIRRRRPRMLFGYPSALAHIARHASARGVVMNDLGITVAFVTAEKLYDEQRSTIERVFGCAVADGYGSREGGFIAHQCPAGGMHITAEDIILEVIDEAGRPVGAGREGEIVVTHLATRDFPFIRYKTGDVGVLSDRECECGRSLPLLGNIQGRTTDFVVAQDGTVMHGLALIYVVRDVRGVRQFKIVQETLDRTRVLLATDQDFSDRDAETIRRGIGKRLGLRVQVQIERVPEVPREASGKYRYVVSHVRPVTAVTTQAR
jgi:phenylacetate-CoA ligase